MFYQKILILVFGVVIPLQLTHTECILTDEEVASKIDQYVDTLLKQGNFSGATLAVVRNGSVLFTKGYGFSNIRKNEPVTPDTKFAIGSITKSFTSQLLSKLITERGLSFDTKVKDFWPGFTAWSGYRYNDLTLRDFLAHKTGVPRNDAIWVFGGRDRDSLLNKARLLKPVFSPRVQMLYNNIMYALAGKVAEEISDSGDSWENLIEDNFLKTIGMNRSGFFDVQENYDDFATPYFAETSLNGTNKDPVELPFETWKNAGNVGPAGSMVSTANDMAKWLITILNDGKTFEGKRIMPKESIDRVFTPEIAYIDTVPESLGNSHDLNRRTSYGLGYYTGYSRGIEFKHHSGSLSGYYSTHTLIRSIKSGFFFSTNHATPGLIRPILENAINNILINKEPPISVEEARTLKPSETIDQPNIFTGKNIYVPNISQLMSRKISSKVAEKFAGRYENWAYGLLRIKATDGVLVQLTAEYGNIGRFSLYPISNNVFIGISQPGASIIGRTEQFTFSNEENGKMKKVQVMFEPMNPPVFERSLGPEPPVDHENCED